MKSALIFPHQLYKISENPALDKVDQIVLIETPLFFDDNYYSFDFHKQKLILHRASMKEYQQKLEQKGYKTSYIPRVEIDSLEQLYKKLSEEANKLYVCDPTDYILEKRIKKYSSQHGIELVWQENPNFINSKSSLKDYFANNNFYQTEFYKQQRKKLDILLDNGEPEGEKWSFDQENRKSLPEDINIPKRVEHEQKDSLAEAKNYVKDNFSENPGSIDNFNYPITRRQALAELRDFFEHRFSNFGPYQDAISDRDNYLFHSVISSSLNIGLLNPLEIAKRAEKYYYEHENVQLQSVEGFIRQIIGWREFMRAVYEFKGTEQRTSNHFSHNRKLPQEFYTGDTGVKPVDDTINKVLETGYAHHIERLMILGNFMLLCEIDPKEIYKWFMELFIDAYDWVMVPNVYGMSQYADGGEIVTKPYISSSNYVLKMSNYGEDKWCEIWDSLYWRFIDKHKEEFSENPRMNFMVSLLNKKDSEKIKEYKDTANKFLSNLGN